MENVSQPGRSAGAAVERAAAISATGLVFNIQRFAVHDGPGVRTTVFLKGCPLACQWCHNPESRSNRQEMSVVAERCIQCASCLEACPEDAVVRLADGTYATDPYHCSMCGDCTDVCPTGGRAIIGQEYTVERVLEEVEKDRVFYDKSGGGVTFSGGEPMAQPVFLLALLEACRARGIHSVVDTCGMVSQSTVRATAKLADLFLYDIKLMDDDRHWMFTGAGNEPILKNLELLAELGADVWIRLPLVPGITDDEENLDALAVFLGALGRDYPIHLLPYHAIARDKYGRFGQNYPLEGLAPPSEAGIAAAAERLRASGLHINIGG